MRAAVIFLALLAAPPASAHCFSQWSYPSDNWHGHHRCDGPRAAKVVATARVASREVKDPPPPPPPIAQAVTDPPAAIQGSPTDTDPGRAMAIEVLKLKMEAPSAVRCK